MNVYTLPAESDLTQFDSGKRLHKTIAFDRKIQVRGFSGYTHDTLYYQIHPPYGSGVWYDTGKHPLSADVITLQLGFPSGNAASGHERSILLRPYLQ